MDEQPANQDGSTGENGADDVGQGSRNESDPCGQQTGTLERLQKEFDEMKDRYLRTAAELENMRRRFEREKADLIKYGMENVFRDFLPVLDSMEKALPDRPEGDPVATGADPAFLQGVMMIKKQIIEVVKRHGLEAIEAQGAPFDPNFHQAIHRQESSEVTTETIANEFARGYLLNGRLLRPAMVSVMVPAN